ncbi:hypothetical protein [Providencia sp. PROV_01]
MIKEISQDKETEIYKILDSFRHAFLSYVNGGLINLYIRQENEGWYPKILLADILEPNQINTLSNNFCVYRGCDISELVSRDYGQSWTLSEQVASNFAFDLYKDNDWFDLNNRVVLTTKLSKKDIFYYSEDYGEAEVIVDTKKLRNVSLHSKI